MAAAIACVLAGTNGAAEPSDRRALLIGIDDYTASRLGKPNTIGPPPGRDWPNLGGSVNDVRAMREMLILLYGFEAGDIVTLTDQRATRRAILESIERHLAAPAAKGDTLLFYYAGHGSQVRNSRSDEPDRLDESIVPADSRTGAPDIRDKELRVLFNRILDRGARLTVILDNCHSGSGARGLPTGARPRSVRLDPRDVADGMDAGPRPEDRGALVLTASQDFDAAWETRDEEGNLHGAFSWAWIRAMRDSSPGEPAADTFLRAQARLRAETPYQEPVMAGNTQARLTPFVGIRRDRAADRTVVAVEKVRDDGTVILQGGWANGLSVGSELRLVSDRRTTTRLTITAMHGLGRSEGRVEPGRRLPASLRSGALMELVAWASPLGRPLRVWTPRVTENGGDIAALARLLATAAAKRDIRWVTDPIDVTPAYVLRRDSGGWTLLGPYGVAERAGSDGGAVAAVARIPPGSSLFVQLPAPAAMVDGVAAALHGDGKGVVAVQTPADADYILAGRYSSRRLEYAWVRPAVTRSDRRKTGLPLRTDWIAEGGRDETLRNSVPALRELVLRLGRIHAWQILESPADARYPYRLAVRRARNGELMDGVLIGDEHYSLLLRATTPLSPRVVPRYVYVFTIDSHGRSVLLFPTSGSVENRFPLPPDRAASSGYPPAEIPLGAPASFEVAPPYGIDTYFLLTTDEPLANPWVLERGGVRTRDAATLTPLERLLVLTASSARSVRIATPSTWSLEKVVFESVPPRLASQKVR